MAGFLRVSRGAGKRDPAEARMRQRERVPRGRGVPRRSLEPRAPRARIGALAMCVSGLAFPYKARVAQGTPGATRRASEAGCLNTRAVV